MSVRTSPALFFVSALACCVPAGALAADNPPQTKPAAKVDPDRNGEPPLIVRNPDGTMTVQKAPVSKADGGSSKGLIIPPQVVVPLARPPTNEKKK